LLNTSAFRSDLIIGKLPLQFESIFFVTLFFFFSRFLS